MREKAGLDAHKFRTPLPSPPLYATIKSNIERHVLRAILIRGVLREDSVDAGLYASWQLGIGIQKTGILRNRYDLEIEAIKWGEKEIDPMKERLIILMSPFRLNRHKTCGFAEHPFVSSIKEIVVRIDPIEEEELRFKSFILI